MPALDPALYPENRRLRRLQALLEVLLLSGILSGVMASLPFAFQNSSFPTRLSAGNVTGAVMLESAITLILLVGVLRLNGESLRTLGLERENWRRNALIGLLLVPLLLLLHVAVSEFLRLALPQYLMKRNPLTDLVRTPLHLALFLGSSWTAAAFKEEVQRAFILRRFGEHLGGYRLGLAVWSVAFGLQHYLQGVQGMVTAALFGFAFGALYLARGNLVGPIIAHGAYDSVALLIYWFGLGGRG